MDLQHVNVKIYVEGDLTVDPARFIEVFHAWIRDSTLPGLLIDVADYRHVPKGPGVMLIGHEADYSMDATGSGYGLLYNQKSTLKGDNASRLDLAFRSAANACRLLEAEFESEGPLTFSRSEFELIINDRAMAPNTAKTFEGCKDDIETFLKNTLGHEDFSLERHADPRCRFGVTVKTAKPFDLASLSEA